MYKRQVYYSASLKEHIARAVDLLTDIVFHSVYPQAEIDKEVEVICDVLLEDGGVINRALLVGVGIQVASHALQTVENVPRLEMCIRDRRLFPRNDAGQKPHSS